MANSAIVGVLRALLTADTAQFDAAMKRSSDSARVWSRDLKQIGAQATQVGAALTKTLTLPLVALGGASAKAAIDFESSFAGVRKTVNATEPEFKALAQAFRDLAKQIPIDVNELNKLGEAAGALGIPKAEIVKFTEVMAKLGVTTNVTAEEAATSIAQIQNVFQAAGKETENFGSALVALGNDGASTEKDILSLTNRLASAGRAINLSQADVLGFSAALANVGIEAEAGGTALSKVFADISIAVSEGGKTLDDFAATAKMSSAEFSSVFKTNAAGAVTAFIEGIGKAKAEGKDLNLVLKDLGFTEVRQARALRDLALSGDNLSKAINLSNISWRENTALSKEAGIRFATVENQLTTLWNRIKDVGITLGAAMLPAIKAAMSALNLLIPVIDTLAKGFAALPGGIQLAIVALGGIVAAIGPAIYIAGQLITSAGQIIAAFTKQGIATKALVGANEALAGSNVALAASYRTLIPLIGAAAAAFIAGGLAVFAMDKAAAQHAGHFNELADVEKEIIRLEKDIALLRQDPDARREASVLKEQLEFLKGKRDALKGLAEEQAKANAAAVEAANIPFVGPMPGAQVIKKNFADEIKKANETIQKEIAGTGLTVGQLTKMLNENEAEFKKAAASWGLSATTIQYLEQQLQKQKKATTESTKAAQELTKETEAQWKQLEKWGIVTKDSVNKQLGELTDGLMAALAQGVPLDKAITLMEPHFQKLAAAAKESGVEVKGLAVQMEVFKRALPTPDVFKVGGGTESLMKVGVVLKDITAASLDAQAQQVRTTEAFEYFGIKTPQALRVAAQAAKDYYRALVESGKAAPEQLKAAREKVLETERAAAHETVSIWKTQIFPAVSGVMQNLVTAVNGSFAQMALGAKSFKEGFIDIWESIKSSVLNIMNSILGSFTNQFLKGMLGAMSGQRGAWSKAFSGLVGGGGGGGGWTGIAKNFVGMGGGAALTGAGYGAAGLATSGLATSTIGTSGAMGVGGTAAAGLSSAALIGLTAGIGAVVVAGIIAYQKNKNTTKETREAFAKELGFLDKKDPKKGDLGALYDQLSKMGAHGQELRNVGQGQVGKKDTEANKKWMEDVAKFMAAVKDFVPIVAGATGNITAGFTSKLAGVFERQTKDQLKAYDDQAKAAQEQTEKLLENEELTADERKAISEKLAAQLKYIEEQRGQFVKDTNAGIVANSQVEFDRLSRIMLGAYNAARAQGKSTVESIQAVGPAIDSLKGSVEQFGFAGNAAFEELLRWRDLVTANAPLLESVSGLTDLMKVMSDVGSLDKQMFADLQAQGLTTYQALIDAGFTEKEARMAIKPLIEEEIKLAKEKKLTLDEGTQAIIAQMRANGELEQEQMSTNDILKQGLGAIIKLLKGDLPAAWNETAKAGEDAADRTERRWGKLRITVPVDFAVGDMPTPPPGFNPTDNPLAFNVPGAQHGGIFTRPSVIGIAEAGPEAAIPLDRLRDMSLGGGGILEASINVFMDGRRVAETQIQHLKFAAKRIGVRPI